MDGLLIDTIPAYVSAMVEAGRDVGHAVSKDYVLSERGDAHAGDRGALYLCRRRPGSGRGNHPADLEPARRWL